MRSGSGCVGSPTSPPRRLPELGKDKAVKELEPHDKRHLDAAQGWLGLGNWREANEELEQITPERRAHPDVLALLARRLIVAISETKSLGRCQ
jgi:hypothetical protein